MIVVTRTYDGKVRTKVKGKAEDVTEQLLNATVSVVEILVEHGKLDKDKIEPFMKDFAQQVIDNIKEGE